MTSFPMRVGARRLSSQDSWDVCGVRLQSFASIVVVLLFLNFAHSRKEGALLYSSTYNSRSGTT
jgi:hypothetical protein